MEPDLLELLISQLDMEALARRVIALTDPDALLDACDVGAWLGCSAKYINTHYLKSPGFPRPMRLPVVNERRSHPRWRRRDITEWLDRHSAGQVPNRRGAKKKSA
jgi:predicted DNA-binding transcriptional regulator AlpA